MFKQRDVLIILWMTFITVAAWVGFNIYHVIVTSTITADLQMQISPIDPNFDTAAINKLKERGGVEPLYQYDNVIEATPEAEISIPPTVIIAPTIAISSTEAELTQIPVKP